MNPKFVVPNAVRNLLLVLDRKPKQIPHFIRDDKNHLAPNDKSRFVRDDNAMILQSAP